jgi:hypothetical protein
MGGLGMSMDTGVTAALLLPIGLTIIIWLLVYMRKFQWKIRLLRYLYLRFSDHSFTKIDDELKSTIADIEEKEGFESLTKELIFVRNDRLYQ